MPCHALPSRCPEYPIGALCLCETLTKNSNTNLAASLIVNWNHGLMLFACWLWKTVSQSVRRVEDLLVSRVVLRDWMCLPTELSQTASHVLLSPPPPSLWIKNPLDWHNECCLNIGDVNLDWIMQKKKFWIQTITILLYLLKWNGNLWNELISLPLFTHRWATLTWSQRSRRRTLWRTTLPTDKRPSSSSALSPVTPPHLTTTPTLHPIHSHRTLLKSLHSTWNLLHQSPKDYRVFRQVMYP